MNTRRSYFLLLKFVTVSCN